MKYAVIYKSKRNNKKLAQAIGEGSEWCGFLCKKIRD